MKKRVGKTIALAAALMLATVNLSLAAGGSIGNGDISVFKDGALANKLSGQNPVEDSALLVCDGKCMVKSDGISLVASDQAQFAISNEADTFNLYVKEGSVDYVINSNARKIAFYTPGGTYTVAEVIFNADSGSVVRGNVTVASDGSTEISVTEGRMIFATAEGMKAVDANNRLVLAQATVPVVAATIPWIPIGGVTAAVIASTLSNDSGRGAVGATTPPVTTPPAATPPAQSPPPAPPTASPAS